MNPLKKKSLTLLIELEVNNLGLNRAGEIIGLCVCIAKDLFLYLLGEERGKREEGKWENSF